MALVALLVGAPTVASAWHIAGSVFCDENGNGRVDQPDSPIQGVTVRVTSLTASPGTSLDTTTNVSGYYTRALSDTVDDYRVALVGGLPPGTSVVMPSSGAYGEPPVPPISLTANARFAFGVDFLLTGCATAPTATPVSTPLVLPTPTEEATATPVETATPTVTPTDVPTPADVPTPTDVATPTDEPTPTDVPTPTVTATDVATPTITPTDVATPTEEPTLTPSVTVTPTSVPTGSVAPTPTDEPTPTVTATPTAEPTPTATESVSSATGTPAATATPVATVTPIVTSTPVPTATLVLPSETPTPVSTPGGFFPAFQCYEIDRASLAEIEDLPVEDRYGATLIDIAGRGKVKRLCNPASVDGQNAGAPDDPNHLVGYVINDREPRTAKIPDQMVTNQFGTLNLTALRPISFLVPSAKSLVGPPAPLDPAPIDHFQCYAVGQAGKARVDDLSVVDQFGAKTLDIKRPSRLCVAADKRGEGVIDPSAALMCYEVRASSGTPAFRGVNGSVYVANQFGPDTLMVTRTTELCVPSTVTTQKLRKKKR